MSNQSEKKTATPENEQPVYQYSLVRKEIEATFGRSIKTARDCQQLSEEILQKTSYSVNYNTLRRFFGIVKADYLPSAATLNILAVYCGFDSAGHLAAHKSKMEYRLSDDEQSMTAFLIKIFRQTETRHENDETFLSVVRQTIAYVNDHPAIADQLQRAIAKTVNGQTFYYEQFVNIDKLNGYYGTGLHYYLAEKKTPEAQVFARALLCQKGWLSNNSEEVAQHYGELVRIPLTYSLHPFTCGRHFATRLFYAHAHGEPAGAILEEARRFHAGLPKGEDNYRLFPCFEYAFAIPLVMTGYYDEARWYLDYALENYSGEHTYLDKALYYNLQLCRVSALWATGERDEAVRIFKKLRPSEFYFLTRKTNTLHYLLMAREMEQPIDGIEEQVDALVTETSFVRFLEMFGVENAGSYERRPGVITVDG